MNLQGSKPLKRMDCQTHLNTTYTYRYKCSRHLKSCLFYNVNICLISDICLLTHAIRHWIHVEWAAGFSQFASFYITVMKHILQLVLEGLPSVKHTISISESLLAFGSLELKNKQSTSWRLDWRQVRNRLASRSITRYTKDSNVRTWHIMAMLVQLRGKTDKRIMSGAYMPKKAYPTEQTTQWRNTAHGWSKQKHGGRG